MLFWLGTYTGCLAQEPNILNRTDSEKRYYLVLDKPGKVSRIRFYAGNNLAFKLTGEKRRYVAKISAIHKRSLVVLDSEIALTEIEQITVPQHALIGKILYGFGNVLRGAGSLFTLVGGSNYLITKDKENGRVTAQAGLTSLIVGQLFRNFNKRTYKINQHRQLKTIEIL